GHFPKDASSKKDLDGTRIDAARPWREADLEPYRDLIGDEFVGIIMVGHLVHPRFSDGDRPASLSRRALTDALRAELGFRGLIVTDDLGRRAITQRYSIEEAATLAVAAGADVVFVTTGSRRPRAVADRIASAIAEAVADGRIPRRHIEESYARI